MKFIVLAYIDPGLGALLWQTIVAAFVGLLFYLKKTRQWIVDSVLKLFGRRRHVKTIPVGAKAAKIESKTEVP
jgi:hypothetical protein